MGRTARDRTRDRPKPVRHIELAANPSKWKGALAVLFLLVGAACLAYAFGGLFAAPTGWQTIEADASDGLSCAQDFVFLYLPDERGANATSQVRALKALYAQATQDAYRLFTADMAYADSANVARLNRSPNEETEVDPALYEAFERIAQSGDRTLYLGPIVELYDDLFSCTDDAQAAQLDPFASDELRAYFAELAAYARDPKQITLELLGENRVRLFVSQEYLAYAKEQEIGRFIDFGVMKNAFITDYLADTLLRAGYSSGTISSFDGFARNLGGVTDTQFALNMYDRGSGAGRPVAKLAYQGARAFCSLRDYPLTAQERTRFYVYEDGTVRSAFLSPVDGLPHACMHDLTLTSSQLSCAQLLLDALPVFACEARDAQALSQLPRAGAHTVYCEGREIVCTDPDVLVTDCYDADGVTYRLRNAPVDARGA